MHRLPADRWPFGRALLGWSVDGDEFWLAYGGWKHYRQGMPSRDFAWVDALDPAADVGWWVTDAGYLGDSSTEPNPTVGDPEADARFSSTFLGETLESLAGDRVAQGEVIAEHLGAIAIVEHAGDASARGDAEIVRAARQEALRLLVVSLGDMFARYDITVVPVPLRTDRRSA